MVLSSLMKGYDLKGKTNDSSSVVSSNIDDDVYDCGISSDTQSVSSRSGVDDADTLYFGKTETRRVGRLRQVVFAILFLVATAVCLGVYFVIGQAQQEEFEAAFDGSASKVIQSMQDIFGERIGALTNFGVSMTSYAQETGSEWPFVTMEDFQQRAGSTRQLSGTLIVTVMPVIAQEHLAAWGPYSMQNAGWINDTRHYQAEIGIPPELSPVNDTQIFPFLATFNPEIGFGPAVECNPCAPAWQTSPLPSSAAINVDLLSIATPETNPYEIARKTAEAGSVYLGGFETSEPGEYNSPSYVTSLTAKLLSLQAKMPVNYTGEPMSTVFTPVMDTLGADRKSVAIVYSTFRWASYFEGVLTDASPQVQIVLENPCEGAFTYTIKGPNVSYDGPGNLADSQYEDMHVFFEVDNSATIFEKDILDLTLKTACGIVLRVYPTVEADEIYNDKFPMYITITIAAIFLFTVGIFIVYDCTVERRQRKVLDTAKRSTAIVSSIFPRRVRDQLMAAPVQGNATKLRSLAHRPKRDSNNLIHEELGKLGSTGPIADLFAEATVMFADVEGFTAWSSVREPSQVFTLLESLYNAFDTIANRHKVFKVETVGD